MAGHPQGGATVDRPDEARTTEPEPKDRPFAALDDDEAPGADADAEPAAVVTAAPLMAGMSGGPPGALGSTGAAAETTRDPETKDASEPKP
jgi:hypothetical protein